MVLYQWTLDGSLSPSFSSLRKGCDVEQTAQAFLEQQGRQKSQHRIKGVPIKAIGVTISELCEIWQVEGKRHYDPDSRPQALSKFR